MSSRENFYNMVSTAGAMVTISRPSTGKSNSALMAGSGTTREYAVSGDDSQDGEDVVMSVYDFEGSGLTGPQKGDRITDGDGSLFAVNYVRKMYGVDGGIGRTLLGWRLRIIG